MAIVITVRQSPCSSCPYRRDVPSGIWAASEYEKLCLAQPERILTADLRWVPAGSTREGDMLLGFEAEKGDHVKNRRMMPTLVTRSQPDHAECVRVTLSDGTSVICTTDHPWLAHNSANQRRFIEARHLLTPAQRGGSPMLRRRVVRLLDTWETDNSRDGGWLAGMYDGEGHLSDRHTSVGYGITMGLSQNPGPVLDYAESLLLARGFKPSRRESNPDHTTVRLDITRTAEVARLLGSIRPLRLLPKFATDRPLPTIDLPDVIVVEPVGEQDIQVISTTTGTYIGEGFAMHNCGYDGETWEQAEAGATGLFFCHRTPDFLCAGWTGCHDMANNLAMRLHARRQGVDPEVYDYVSPVPLFSSGAEAAAHGLRDLSEPGDTAQAKVRQLQRVVARRKKGEGS